MSISRRDLLRSAVLLPAAPLIGQRKFSKPLGVQLYTLRRLFPARTEEALRTLAEIGYTEVETFSAASSRLADLFREVGLKPVSGHFETPLITGNWKAWEVAFPSGQPSGYTWEAAIDIAGGLGLKYMVVPYLMPAERTGRDTYLRLAESMNTAGEKVRAAGMKLCYHNHGFEFSGFSGKRPFDVLMESFDPKLVFWELDIFWCSLAGYDPAELISQYPGRFVLLHLKDKLAGAKRETDERVVRPEVFKEAGAGDIDLPEVLRAAESNGVEHYFVEQDECPGDPLVSVRQSYEYLRNLTY